jgi:hypothetical protein
MELPLPGERRNRSCPKLEALAVLKPIPMEQESYGAAEVAKSPVSTVDLENFNQRGIHRRRRTLSEEKLQTVAEASFQHFWRARVSQFFNVSHMYW